MNEYPTHKDYAEDKGRRDSPSECQLLCQQTKGCKAFVWKPNRNCWLKKAYSKRIHQDGSFSGKRECDQGIHLLIYNTI